jgi:stage V sporulation protein G
VEITDVRVRLAERGNERLCGYCTITIDAEFVVRDLRIIAGEKGLFVAMPSRKTTHRCPRCAHKNVHHAHYCNECGGQLKPRPAQAGDLSRLHVDIAHPITPECRRRIQDTVLTAFEDEKRRSGGPEAREHHYENQEEESDFEYA